MALLLCGAGPGAAGPRYWGARRGENGGIIYSGPTPIANSQRPILSRLVALRRIDPLFSAFYAENRVVYAEITMYRFSDS